MTPADILEEQEGQADGGLPETVQLSIQDVLGGPNAYHPAHGRCNVQLADEIMLVSIISLIVTFCTCAGTKQLDIHKTCAVLVTPTGKRPPNRDPELQRTELVQDTKALMVQDTKDMLPETVKLSIQDVFGGPNSSSSPKMCCLSLWRNRCPRRWTCMFRVAGLGSEIHPNVLSFVLLVLL